jgi:hypothetical protein
LAASAARSPNRHLQRVGQAGGAEHAALHQAALVAVPPGEQRHVVLPARREGLGRALGQDPAVEDGIEAEAGIGRGPHRQDLGLGALAQRGQVVTAERLGEGDAVGLAGRQGRVATHRAEGRAALADGALEQALGLGRGHQPADGVRARRFAGDGHLSGSPPKGDIGPHPAQGRDHVGQGLVAAGLVGRFLGQFRMGEEAEGPRR